MSELVRLVLVARVAGIIGYPAVRTVYEPTSRAPPLSAAWRARLAKKHFRVLRYQITKVRSMPRLISRSSYVCPSKTAYHS